jgi:hypothetical protein
MDFADQPLTWLGAAATLLAALAWLGDWRRQRRKNADAVGWVPWVGLFFLAVFAALVLLALGIREWF